MGADGHRFPLRRGSNVCASAALVAAVAAVVAAAADSCAPDATTRPRVTRLLLLFDALARYLCRGTTPSSGQ